VFDLAFRVRLRRAYSIQGSAFSNSKKKQILRSRYAACGFFSGKEIPFSLPDTLTDDNQKKIFCVVILSGNEESAFISLQHTTFSSQQKTKATITHKPNPSWSCLLRVLRGLRG
jgi:hypothetical protein